MKKLSLMVIVMIVGLLTAPQSFAQHNHDHTSDKKEAKHDNGEMGFNPAIPVMKKIADNIYMYSQFMYNSMIMITNDGVYLTDPAGAERAKIMRAEIKKLTDLPVTKVIYSHDHYDHTRGGEIFKEEGADFISHENAIELIQRDPYKSAIVPTVTYKDKMSIQLKGGSTVELMYYGPNDGDAMSVIYFPKEKILYAVDFHLPLYINEPYRLVTHNYGGILHTLKRIKKELPMEIVIPGHGPQSSPELFDEDLRFVQALYDAALEGLKAGKKPEDLKNEIKLPEFSHWRGYEKNLPSHVERMTYTIWHGN